VRRRESYNKIKCRYTTC